MICLKAETQLMYEENGRNYTLGKKVNNKILLVVAFSKVGASTTSGIRNRGPSLTRYVTLHICEMLAVIRYQYLLPQGCTEG